MEVILDMNRFLVANDDGINALGIQSLIKRLAYYGEVYVCAPSSQRSCMSQCMTLRDSITVASVEVPNAKAAFQCSGTPADCVKFGVQWASDNGIELDYVFSGINHGANGGTDIRYSGTMGAAMEGAMSGIRSIAMSVFSHEATEFEYILDMIPELLDISSSLSSDVVLNVNAPNLPKWKIAGVKFASCGPRSFVDRFIVAEGSEDEKRDTAFDSDYDFASNMKYPEGKAEYKYNGTLLDFKGMDESIDLGAIANDYATVTPVKVDATDYDSLIKLNRLNEDKTLCLFMNFQEKLEKGTFDAKAVLDKAKMFAECAEILELKILYSKHFAGELGDISEKIKPALIHAEQIDTVSFDLFDVPDFEKNLWPYKESNIVIAGLEAHVSVLQTALAFLKRGYRVTVLSDCCHSRDMEDLDAAMELLSKEGCTITTYEALVYKLIGNSNHRYMEELRAIINESSYCDRMAALYDIEVQDTEFEDTEAQEESEEQDSEAPYDFEDAADYEGDDEEYRQVSLDEILSGARRKSDTANEDERNGAVEVLDTGENYKGERKRFAKSKRLKRLDDKYIPEPAERLIPDSFGDE